MKRKRKSGKTAKKAKANQSVVEQEQDYTKAPHSFVFHRGHVGKPVKELIGDIRKVMEPYTATKLKIRKKNVMKDFLTIAGTLHVSHFVVLSKTDIATYLKLICVPKGPTLTFKLNEYCLARDVLSAQRHPDVDTKLFSSHAVMVTNIPTESMENRLINVTFKNMFPSINPNTVSLNKMRRCVLINYDPSNKSIDLRHYTMKVVPTGLSRGMKKLMKSKLPNLSGRNDISELFLDKGLSDSEGEQDGPHNQVMVPQRVKDRGVKAHSMNAIRLKEIGPRLNMSLVKIEEGFEAGNVLYHAFVEKTPEELAAARALNKEKQKLKIARKQKQASDIKKKEQAKEEQVRKTREGMERKVKAQKDTSKNERTGDEDEDDDVEYYRKEVGQEPEPELFSQMRNKRKVPQESSGPKTKKTKFSFKKEEKSPAKKADNKTHKFSAKFTSDSKKAMKGKVFKGKSQGKPFGAEKKGKNFKSKSKR